MDIITAIYIIASVIMAEAKGEGQQGMKLVADVIHTRTQTRKLSAIEVVTDQGEFHGLYHISKQNHHTPEGRFAYGLACELVNGVDPIPNQSFEYFTSNKPLGIPVNSLRYKNHLFYNL